MMADYELYPLNMNLYEKKVLVVGGGNTGLRKITSLLACGAFVTVVSRTFSEAINELADKGTLVRITGQFQKEMCFGCCLIFACTSDRETNRRIVAAAKELNIPVNCVDDPAACDFTVPASFSRGDLLVAVSTGASSPALSASVKRKLENIFGDEWIVGLSVLQEARKRIKNEISDPKLRSKILKNLGSDDIMELIEAGQIEEIKERVEKLIACCE